MSSNEVEFTSFRGEVSMTNHPNHSLVPPFQAQAELELLQFILEEPVVYPFNPIEPEAEAYFAALEQEMLAMGWPVEELDQQGQQLSQRLDQLWATVTTPVAVVSADALSAFLQQRFAARAPKQLLTHIAQQAQQVAAQNLTLAEQLVQCVQACLPTWGADDLQVFARPLAFAMRAPEPSTMESTIDEIRSVDWEKLSQVEQARLSLAIARYALAQVSSEAADVQ
jgi:hypothetical protein